MEEAPAQAVPMDVMKGAVKIVTMGAQVYAQESAEHHVVVLVKRNVDMELAKLNVLDMANWHIVHRVAIHVGVPAWRIAHMIVIRPARVTGISK